MLIFAAGVIGLPLAFRFGRERNAPLVTFSTTAVLYGIRLLAGEAFIRAVVPVPPAFWQFLIAAIRVAAWTANPDRAADDDLTIVVVDWAESPAPVGVA